MGSAGLQIDVEDGLSAARLNQKTSFIGTGAQIAALGTTYAGQIAYCTTTGSGFTADTFYIRNAANSAWNAYRRNQSGDLLYTLSTTIGDYSSPTAAVPSSTATGDLDSDTFTSGAAWTATGTNVSITAGVAREAAASCGTWNAVYRALSSTLSDSVWVTDIDFIWTAATGSINGFGLILAAGTSDPATSSQDMVGINVNYNGASAYVIGMCAKDGAGAVTFSTNITIALSTQYYLRFERTSTTNIRLSVFSDSGRTSHVAGSPVNFTIAAGITALNTVMISTKSNEGGGSVTADWDNLDINSEFPSTNAWDNNTATRWQSNSETNPKIYFDLGGAAARVVGVALNIDKTNTTETQIKLRMSTDTTFTDGETIRTIDISDFTDDTYRFILVNITNKRYLEVYGVGTSKVLAINELKYRAVASDTTLLENHYHGKLATTDTESGVDSN